MTLMILKNADINVHSFLICNLKIANAKYNLIYRKFSSFEERKGELYVFNETY